MRLSKIKMSGFKSFVDPTTIHLPSNLVGIVGPNGCGKSNVIDAVRWVMGELSAKQLRGESMADVIFNGSSARKPVSAASIELLFDNADGAVGGQFANYAEISVRREVVRDGTSNYFLNNARCRRRDVTDLFLGTGLGPRSYAIIEQGTITRLVESKPEEMRVFLEEAAGISRYKERRRETESRIHATRENIERLNDVLEEISKQIEHLHRQARAAERYKTLNEEKRRLEAELKALHWRELDEQVGGQDRGIREQETRLEAAIAEQRALESELEKTRARHTRAGDGLNEVQARSYELATATARLEQSLQHLREARRQHQQDFENLQVSRQEVEGHLSRDREQIAQAETVLADFEPAHTQALAGEQRSAQLLAEAERALQAWQERWEAFNREANEHAQGAEVARTRIEHLDRQLAQEFQRREKLLQERSGLPAGAKRSDVAGLDEALRKAEAARTQLQAKLERATQELEGLRESDQQLTAALHDLRSRLEDQRGRLASLDALQQAALGRSRTQVGEWLKQRKLSGEPRLAELISVAPGWERAVETVLGYHLEAVCVDRFADDAAEFASLAGGSLTFVEKAAAAGAVASGSLLAKVQSPLALDDWLGQVRTADDLPAALAMRSRLAAGESVIIRDGLWFGRHWLRVIRGEDERAGVLARAQELKQRQAQLATIEREAAAKAARQESARHRMRELEAQREELQDDLNQAHAQQAELHARQQSVKDKLQQVAQRAAQLDAEIGELDRQLASAQSELQSVQSERQAALAGVQALESRREALQTERDALRGRVEEARTRAKQDAEVRHGLALKFESQRSTRDSTRQNLERVQAQLLQMDARRSALQQAIEDAQAPMRQQETELKSLLQRRAGMDNELGAARLQLESIAEQVRTLERQRQASEHRAEEQRGQLQQLQLGTQEARVRRTTLEEQLRADGYALEQVLSGLNDKAGITEWTEKLAGAAQRIERLGPINLAAIQEYNEQAERKQYLDSQLADLNQALDTLRAAIHKIDRETRARFQETFDKVNAGLQTSFPKLFGGGHAYLELTGEELLDAGVTIMARPPGKRNSTIHLLSGGEKALTAVALVFSIFELNPAPFCLLDEVDAPLDEANIGRFGDLVRGMSDRVQFVFITHNKSTMEMANQLIGVTMSEPGVSRLVDVDVDEAVRIAAM
ncbi:MAG: chromosome segregation protein SMC [Gammaproteobacteria bacterium]|nr:chromosome segregation protein SMC [Gammaproteobacteria bacterium]MBU6508659.1 chromosome segregation protein SMC [Gammaproteobacteria bacterium]